MLARLAEKLGYVSARRLREMDAPDFGAWAERHVCKYLKRQGLRLADRNFRTRVGEIDIIVTDGTSIVFVEVKAERSEWGDPELKFTDEKGRRIVKAAKAYIARHDLYEMTARLDLVTVRLLDGGSIEVEHEEDVYQA